MSHMTQVSSNSYQYEPKTKTPRLWYERGEKSRCSGAVTTLAIFYAQIALDTVLPELSRI